MTFFYNDPNPKTTRQESKDPQTVKKPIKEIAKVGAGFCAALESIIRHSTKKKPQVFTHRFPSRQNKGDYTNKFLPVQSLDLLSASLACLPFLLPSPSHDSETPSIPGFHLINVLENAAESPTHNLSYPTLR